MDPRRSRRPVRVGAGAVVGVDAIPVTVEAVMHGDGHTVQLLGSIDRVVREAFHRVLNAFVAEGLPSPRGRPVVNFAPAGLPKTGTGFDLPLAISLAGAGGQLPPGRLDGLVAAGEIGLDGRVLPVRGIVPIAIAARDDGSRVLVTGVEDAGNAAVVPGIDVLAVERLSEAIAYCQGRLSLTPVEAPSLRPRPVDAALEFGDIRGHETAKRALCAVAAGRHNLLLVGPPGSGKSALARRLPALLPPPTTAERLDILRVASACGIDAPHGRPLRAPHHSSSPASLLGGGPDPRAGEVTLAHHGVLFLDELPEFRREALEGLRQPIEEQSLTIGRASRTITVPADFVLVAAMNPCPCGHDGDARRVCRCSSRDRHTYRARISGPLLDRFDLVVPVPASDPASWDVPPDPAWSTGPLRARVVRAAERQHERGGAPNGRRDDHESALDASGRDALARVMRLHRLSGRGRTRLLRLARTLADLREVDAVRELDVLEASRMRAAIT